MCKFWLMIQIYLFCWCTLYGKPLAYISMRKYIVFENSNESKWMASGICFLLLLYGGGGEETTESLTKWSTSPNSWQHKGAYKSETYHQLEHIKRVRLQVIIWRAADEYNISRLELSKFGSIKEDNMMVLIHGNVYVTPNVHVQHVACSCKSRETCSCRSAKTPCTSYCKWQCEAHRPVW